MLFVHIMVAGIVGTILMSLVMTFIHRAGWANADMIRALGSMVTGSYEGSLAPGLLMHLIAGILFAIPYTVVLQASGIHAVGALVAMGGAIGVLHGAGMSFVLLALVAERHPVQQFQTAGVEVAAAHVAGHIVYGLGVGLVIGLFL